MRLVEHLRLGEAAAVAASVDPVARASAREGLADSEAASASAETLWAAGRVALGLGRALDGLRAALDAARAISPDATLEERLARAGLDATARARVAAAAGALEAPAPASDGAVGALHGAQFVAAQEASDTLRRALAPRLLDEVGLGRLRRARLATALAVVVGVALLALWPTLFPAPRIDVRASAYRVNDTVETWPPENAVDRDETTYWHLPPGEAGWIELELTPPRHVSALRIMNAHDNHVRDPHRADRRPFHQASREIRVHAFADGQRVAEVDATLEPITDWTRVTIPLGGADGDGGGLDDVERIRIEIRSFYEEGGGLAEIEVLE